MIRREQVVGFQRDEGNARNSADSRGVTQAEAEQLFFNEPLVVRDARHSHAEARFHALGVTHAGRALHVAFALRVGGTLIRVISARHRKERAIHAEATQQGS